MNSESVKPWVHSVNVSGPLRTLNFAGTEVTTGFFKMARPGVAYARKLGLEGDAQADLSMHGGPEKAVYFYPREHYPVWEAVLGAEALPPGSFGENITSEGLLESEVNIGDILQIGTATFQVIQPRSPCYKLQIRFGRSDMTALFFQQAKPGWYASVIREGTPRGEGQDRSAPPCPGRRHGSRRLALQCATGRRQRRKRTHRKPRAIAGVLEAEDRPPCLSLALCSAFAMNVAQTKRHTRRD